MKVLYLGLAACVYLRAAAADLPQLPPQLQGITIEQHLGAQLPLDAQFQNENGESVALGSFFGKRPVVLALIYYRCPMLCSRILSGVMFALKPLDLKAGRDFNVVAISINPSETPAEAAAKRDEYTQKYSGHAGSPGWHFLVGTPESIKAVTEAAGFHYRWDPATQMYFHASGIMVATPQGKMSRYLYGVEYEPKDLNLALIESSNNKIGSPADRILLFCSHYDPAIGKYTIAVMNVLRASAVLVMIAMGAGFWWLSRRVNNPPQVRNLPHSEDFPHARA
jgi:protein SCO1/2